jgi:hypothetical protein
MQLRRLALTTATVIPIALAMFATPAAAVPPHREPLQFPDQIIFAAGDFCPWPALVTFPVNNETATTFYDGQGNVTRVLITGSLRVSFENTDTGNSETFNIPGSSVTVGSTLIYRGRNVIFPVAGELNLVSGRVVVTVDSQGFQHPVSVNGSTTDICALLG